MGVENLDSNPHPPEFLEMSGVLDCLRMAGSIRLVKHRDEISSSIIRSSLISEGDQVFKSYYALAPPQPTYDLALLNHSLDDIYRLLIKATERVSQKSALGYLSQIPLSVGVDRKVNSGQIWAIHKLGTKSAIIEYSIPGIEEDYIPKAFDVLGIFQVDFFPDEESAKSADPDQTVNYVSLRRQAMRRLLKSMPKGKFLGLNTQSNEQYRS